MIWCWIASGIWEPWHLGSSWWVVYPAFWGGECYEFSTWCRGSCFYAFCRWRFSWLRRCLLFILSFSRAIAIQCCTSWCICLSWRRWTCRCRSARRCGWLASLVLCCISGTSIRGSWNLSWFALSRRLECSWSGCWWRDSLTYSWVIREWCDCRRDHGYFWR